MKNIRQYYSVIIVLTIYIASYFVIVPINSQIANALAIVPVVFAGRAFGKRGGLLGGAILITFVVSMTYFATGLQNPAFTFIGSGVLLLVGLSVGHLQDMRSQLDLELQERRKYERILRESENRYRAVVEDQTDFVMRFLPDTTRTFVSTVYCNHLNRSRDDLMGAKVLDELGKEERAKLEKKLAYLSIENPVATNEYKYHDATGSLRWESWTNRAIFDDEGKIMEIQAVGRDITKRKHEQKEIMEAREEAVHAQEILAIANKKLELLASNDGLTGIANRRSFDNKLAEEWRRSTRSKGPTSLILFDIDYFKGFNDHYGHQAGDDVLKEVGTLLLESNRPGPQRVSANIMTTPINAKIRIPAWKLRFDLDDSISLPRFILRA